MREGPGRTARGAHRKLEEPVVPGRTVLALEDEATVTNELVPVVATVGEAVSNKVKANSSEAGIKQVLQHDVSAVFVADRSRGELHIKRSVVRGGAQYAAVASAAATGHDTAAATATAAPLMLIWVHCRVCWMYYAGIPSAWIVCEPCVIPRVMLLRTWSGALENLAQHNRAAAHQSLPDAAKR